VVTEFFGYAVNSILYQRGIYPPEDFQAVSKYGLSMLVTCDDGLRQYLGQVLTQLSEWLLAGSVQNLVIAICDVETGESLERWEFKIETDGQAATCANGVEHDESRMTSEIQAIIRQITASVTFLPLLSKPCTFDLLVYTDKNVEIPQAWEESDPRYIAENEEVKLRSFTTKIHKIDAAVSFKAEEY